MNEYRVYLENLSEEKYKEFSSKLIPNVENILGVRTPYIKKYAKSLVKTNWAKVLEELNDSIYLEEKLLQAFIIAEAKMEQNERLVYIRTFVPKIDNWALCDGFCSSLKFTKTNKDLVWDFLKEDIFNVGEYPRRFKIVMFLNYFLEEKYINEIFKIINSIDTKEYYLQMAIAWLVSKAYIKCKEETTEFLMLNNLDDFTYNKSLQKIIESNIVSLEEKEYIKSLKKILQKKGKNNNTCK